MDYPKSKASSLDLNVDKKFSDGDIQAGMPASIIPASWANALTDEFLAVIMDAGLTPDEHQTDQLKVAVQTLLEKPKKEIENVITNAGLTLNNTVYTQLLSAINLLTNTRRLIFSSQTGATAGTLSESTDNFDTIHYLNNSRLHSLGNATQITTSFTDTTYSYNQSYQYVTQTTFVISSTTFNLDSTRWTYKDTNFMGEGLSVGNYLIWYCCCPLWIQDHSNLGRDVLMHQFIFNKNNQLIDLRTDKDIGSPPADSIVIDVKQPTPEQLKNPHNYQPNTKRTALVKQPIPKPKALSELEIKQKKQQLKQQLTNVLTQWQNQIAIEHDYRSIEQGDLKQ